MTWASQRQLPQTAICPSLSGPVAAASARPAVPEGVEAQHLKTVSPPVGINVQIPKPSGCLRKSNVTEEHKEGCVFLDLFDLVRDPATARGSPGAGVFLNHCCDHVSSDGTEIQMWVGPLNRHPPGTQGKLLLHFLECLRLRGRRRAGEGERERGSSEGANRCWLCRAPHYDGIRNPAAVKKQRSKGIHPPGSIRRTKYGTSVRSWDKQASWKQIQLMSFDPPRTFGPWRRV